MTFCPGSTQRRVRRTGCRSAYLAASGCLMTVGALPTELSFPAWRPGATAVTTAAGAVQFVRNKCRVSFPFLYYSFSPEQVTAERHKVGRQGYRPEILLILKADWYAYLRMNSARDIKLCLNTCPMDRIPVAIADAARSMRAFYCPCLLARIALCFATQVYVNVKVT